MREITIIPGNLLKEIKVTGSCLVELPPELGERFLQAVEVEDTTKENGGTNQQK